MSNLDALGQLRATRVSLSESEHSQSVSFGGIVGRDWLIGLSLLVGILAFAALITGQIAAVLVVFVAVVAGNLASGPRQPRLTIRKDQAFIQIARLRYFRAPRTTSVDVSQIQGLFVEPCGGRWDVKATMLDGNHNVLFSVKDQEDAEILLGWLRA